MIGIRGELEVGIVYIIRTRLPFRSIGDLGSISTLENILPSTRTALITRNAPGPSTFDEGSAVPSPMRPFLA